MFGIVIRNIILFVEYLSLFYAVFCREFRKSKLNKIWIIIVSALVFVGPSALGFSWATRLVGPVQAFFVPFVIFTWMIFDISIGEAIALSIADWLVISILEFAVTVNMLQFSAESWYLDLAMLIIIVLAWLFYFISKNIFSVKILRLPVRMWILIDMIMVILVAMMSFLEYVIIKLLPENGMNAFGRLLLVLSGAGIIILLFVLVYYSGSSYTYKAQKELAEMQALQQKEYFSRLLKREEETKKFRHDIMNDLLEMKNYCEKQEYQKLEQYLDNMTGDIKNISKSTYDVGNDVVNTVLNYYLLPVKKNCLIDIDGFMSEEMSIDDRDLCVVFANLIKNACEASQNCESGHIWINIKEGRDNLFIQVKNTFEGHVLFDKKGVPVTSKADKDSHGLGLKNVIDTVSRNKGTYSFSASDNVFKAEVYLKL